MDTNMDTKDVYTGKLSPCQSSSSTVPRCTLPQPVLNGSSVSRTHSAQRERRGTHSKKKKLTDEPPMFLNSPGQRYLLTDLGTRGRGQLNLGKVALDAQHASAGRGRANVNQQQLVLGQLGHLGLFLVFCSDAEQATEQKETDFEFLEV